MVKLIDKAQRAVAQRAARRLAQIGQQLALHADFAAAGRIQPANRCKSVLLPEPEAPTMAMRSPAATCKLTSASTLTFSGPS